MIAPHARTVTIHNFVNEGEFCSSVAACGVSRSRDIVLFLGEIGQRKGIFDLLRAFRRVIEVNPGACLIAGGTGDIAAATDLARQLGIEAHVSFPGWVAGDAKHKLFARAAIYALPSHNEGLPVSILEAMAAGLPIISTPVGGVPDAVTDGVEGFLITPGDVDSLADRICRLLADEHLRQTMGENATRALDAKFSSAAATAAIDALYHEFAHP
jgi:glycosyltransferase involved in cell wall biosynthesis